MRSFSAFIVCFFFAMFSISAGNAQIAFNAGGANGGAVIPGWSSDSCVGSIEGAIRYNSSGGGSVGTIQYCDGVSWIDWQG